MKSLTLILDRAQQHSKAHPDQVWYVCAELNFEGICNAGGVVGMEYRFSATPSCGVLCGFWQGKRLPTHALRLSVVVESAPAVITDLSGKPVPAVPVKRPMPDVFDTDPINSDDDRTTHTCGEVGNTCCHACEEEAFSA